MRFLQSDKAPPRKTLITKGARVASWQRSLADTTLIKCSK